MVRNVKRKGEQIEMSTEVQENVKVAMVYAEQAELLPEEIERDAVINLRPYSDGLADVESLAESIKLNGQIEPVVVRLDSEGRAHLVAGNRRVTAIALINAGFEDGIEPMRVRAVVHASLTDDMAWRMAWAENKDRENMSPMDIAGNIANLRGQFGWKGKAGTKAVSEYLGMSPAFVTTYEKLLKQPKQIQDQVHVGKLSVDAALKAVVSEESAAEVGKSATEVQAEVLQKAEELAKAEQARREVAEYTGAKVGKSTKAGKGGALVKGRHVQAAKRKVAGSGGEKAARNKAEIVDFFESELQSPLFGYENSTIQKFVGYFLKWVQGDGSDRGLVERFKVMVEGVDRGTAPPVAKEAKAPVVKASATATKKKASKKK